MEATPRPEARFYIGPDTWSEGDPNASVTTEDRARIESAIVEGGGILVEAASDAEAIVWLSARDTDGVTDLLHAGIRWVQLPAAGVERFLRDGVIAEGVGPAFSAVKGAYDRAVSEQALALMLAAARGLHECARAREWHRPSVRSLRGAAVAIVGAGGIGRALMDDLEPFAPRILAVNRSGSPVPGADETFDMTRLKEVWGRADYVVLSAPATEDTYHLVAAPELAAMRDDAWLVNVARGSLVDTDALVDALRTGSIGGAAVDVTDPEPLPAGHALWELPNCLISPHSSTPDRFDAFVRFVSEQVERYVQGQRVHGLVDASSGY